MIGFVTTLNNKFMCNGKLLHTPMWTLESKGGPKVKDFKFKLCRKYIRSHDLFLDLRAAPWPSSRRQRHGPCFLSLSNLALLPHSLRDSLLLSQVQVTSIIRSHRYLPVLSVHLRRTTSDCVATMPSKSTKPGFYAVRNGRNIGVYNTW